MSKVVAPAEHVQESQSNESTDGPKKKQRVQKSISKLLQLLLEKGEFSKHVMDLILRYLTLDKMSPLMTTCRDIYNEDFVLFQAPKKWIDNTVRKLFEVMTAMESRWTSWICTSKVEEMVLSVDDSRERDAPKLVTDEWISYIVRSGKF